MKRWLTVISLATVVIVISAYFLLGPRDYSNDPRVVEIREIQEEARKRYLSDGGPSTQTEARAFVQSMEQVRTKMEGLPSDVRRELYRGGGNVFYSSMRQRIDDYFNASPVQRQRVLDQQIRQSDLMSKAFSEARAARAAQESSGSGQQRKEQQKDGQSSGRSSWASQSQGDRNDWFKNRILDRTTPEQRAKYVEYRRAASERREELGLPAGWP
ncbi:MAG: hypothetical protein P8J43_00435 [Pirellulales bacterium]|nr:hypothetical protein [Pirellulales bacterium]